MNRREFTKSAGLGVFALATPMARSRAASLLRYGPDGPRIPLGVCNHSLRSMRFNVRELLNYAAEQRLDSVLINTLKPFDRLDSAYLTGLGSVADTEQMSLYIGVGSISERSTLFSNAYGSAEQLLKTGIQVAADAGSPIVACRIGSIEDRYGEGGIAAHIEDVVALMRSMRNRALDAGIKFAFENHMGDLRSKELLTLITAVGKDVCGALFDPANAVWALEHPMTALKNLGSSVICTSVRDVQLWETESGVTFQGVALGEGIIDFPAFVTQLTETCPGVPLQVETISNSFRSIPLNTPEFWDGFPELKSNRLDEFTHLAKSGNPIEIVPPSPETSQHEHDVELQKRELQKSFTYARRFCRAGLK